MDKWKDKVAIVTGTSSGIGSAIAKTLVEAGVQVVGLGRRKDRGEALAKILMSKGKFYPRAVDITKEDDVLETFKWIKENLGPVHILINNAAIKHSTTLTEGDTKMWKDTFDTNVLALSVTTREAVKNMRDNNVNGHIIHINSVSSHTIPPSHDLNVYAASKCAVAALTETLRQELGSSELKIKISSVSPGFVLTEMTHPDLLKSSGFKLDVTFLNPDDIADAVIYVLSTPPHVQVHEILIRPVGQTV